MLIRATAADSERVCVSLMLVVECWCVYAAEAFAVVNM